MKKRILFLITDLGGGGAERVLVNLVNNLNSSKYEITVKTIFDTGINRQFIKSHVRYIPGLKKQPHGNVAIMRMIPARMLYKFFVRDEYDCVVAFLEGPPARIISGCNLEETKKIAWIHVEHDNTTQLTYAFRNIKEAEKVYNGMDLIVCVADTVREDFTSLLNISTPVVTAYNVNESEKVKELGKESIVIPFDDNVVNVISVGRLINMKGYDRLIRVHRRLIDERVQHRIYILGDGNGRERLQALIKEQQVEESFFLLGFDKNPYKYVEKADLFVCSSLREGFSTAVTEALILGVPVVSTEVSGARELLGQNNEYGIVTDNDENALYMGLKEMLMDSEKREYYRQKATVRGKAFITSQTVKAVEDLINNVLRK